MKKSQKIVLIITCAIAVVFAVCCIVGFNYNNSHATPETTTTAVTTTAEAEVTTTTAPEVTTEATTTTTAAVTTTEMTTEKIIEVTAAPNGEDEATQTLAPVETPAPEIQEAYDNGNLEVKPAETTAAATTTQKPVPYEEVEWGGTFVDADGGTFEIVTVAGYDGSNDDHHQIYAQ